MPSVLFIGQQPESVDFTSSVLPLGMNAEKIHAGIAVALKQMAERGWLADLCLLRPDETAGPDVPERSTRFCIFGTRPCAQLRHARASSLICC